MIIYSRNLVTQNNKNKPEPPKSIYRSEFDKEKSKSKFGEFLKS